MKKLIAAIVALEVAGLALRLRDLWVREQAEAKAERELDSWAKGIDWNIPATWGDLK